MPLLVEALGSNDYEEPQLFLSVVCFSHDFEVEVLEQQKRNVVFAGVVATDQHVPR